VARAKRKYGKGASDKIGQTLHEWKRGKLKSSSGHKVKSQKQAIAIGISQARRSGYKVPPEPSHATMTVDERVRAYLSHMRPDQEIDALGMARALKIAPMEALIALERAAMEKLATQSADGRWYGPARGRSLCGDCGLSTTSCRAGARGGCYEGIATPDSPAHVVTRRGTHATRKSPAQLDKEIAEFMTNPKLGDPTWEREWSELLTEKHSKARMPTVDELARAFRYIENEFRIKDGRVSMEQWAEGLAFGRFAGDADDKYQAKEMMKQVSAATWLRAAERANALSREQGEAPRYVA